MKINLVVYGALPCATETFEIDGVKSEQDWFVNNYDEGSGEEIEYGCNNRETEKLSLEEVRKNLPKELKYLTDGDIEKIQSRLEDELVSGGCGWCV